MRVQIRLLAPSTRIAQDAPREGADGGDSPGKRYRIQAPPCGDPRCRCGWVYLSDGGRRARHLVCTGLGSHDLPGPHRSKCRPRGRHRWRLSTRCVRDRHGCGDGGCAPQKFHPTGVRHRSRGPAASYATAGVPESEYSWCSPLSTDFARTSAPGIHRRRDSGFEARADPAGGPGTPGPVRCADARRCSGQPTAERVVSH